MKVRVVVAGGRDYNDYKSAKSFIEENICDLLEEGNEIIFISGGCRGADALSERFALENGFEIEKYLAQWERYGRAAGPKRNKKMVDTCHRIICFWDGKSKGTKSTIFYATKSNKDLRIKLI